MNFRTSHLVGLIATGIVAITAPSINSVAAEPLKITGPDGQVKQSIRQYGPTTSADTFWSIAQGVKPDNSVTVYQVMTALYDANPHAFSSKNYNSLERGMILLVPSKAVMLQTSQADAKARAERNDRRWTSSPVAVKPSVTAKTVAPTSVSPRATPKPAVVAKHNPLIAELSAEVAALTKQMEDIQAQNLALTDELARASDEIVVGSSDTAAFQDEISQLKEENALLKQALQDSKSENEALNQQLQLKQQQLATAPEPQLEAKQEPTSDLWRTILDNPLLLVLGAVLPALLVIMLFWLFIRRRNDAKTEEPSADDAPVIEKHSDAQADGTLEDKLDDADGLAVHLDTDDSSSMTPLKGALAADAFAEEQDIVVEDSQDEGQSLDDLWAEAMGEQDQNETDEFDAFNNTLTTASSDDSASMSSDEADLDSLLAGFDEPAEQEQEQQLSGDKDDDLDALLAGFEHDDDQVVQLEQSNETGVATEDDIDDIDALLADFDTSNPEASAEDDLDALLAGFEHDNDQVVQLEQSNETGVATEDDIDDIDALLADFDTSNPEASAEDDLDALLAGFEHNDDQVVQLEQSNETGVATEDDIDDIDALLADFDTSNTNDAQSVNDTEASADDDLDTLLAQLEAEDKSQDDDNELKDIDALSDEMAAELELGFEIAAELELSTTEDTEQQLESDLDRELDALLADLEAPVAELKTEEQSEVQSERAPILEQQAEQELKVEPTPETAQEATAASIQDSNSLDFELSDFEPEVLKSGADSAETEVAGTKVEDMLEFTLPEVDVEPAIDAELTLEQVSETVTSDRESGFFDDLKGNKKPEGNSLDWESIASQSDIAADEELAFSASNERSDDELLTGLTTEGDSQILPFEIEGDEAFSLSDDSKMTVDEALAALDAEELDAKELAGKVPGKSAVAMHDLTTFQKDNGFIDIDMLLSEADEDNGDTDLYKELDVDMGELDSLMGHSPMVDVDDEENSVNAKLDLARAYIEIDDNDSARALLKEVELDGNDRQQTEALGLLKDLV